MPTIFETEEGDCLVYNTCTKCGRFLKFNDCKLLFYQEGYRWEIDGAAKATGKCKKCGEVELDFEF